MERETQANAVSQTDPDHEAHSKLRVHEEISWDRRLVLAGLGLASLSVSGPICVGRSVLRMAKNAEARGRRMEQTLLIKTQRRGDATATLARSLHDVMSGEETPPDQREIERQVERILTRFGIPTRDLVARLDLELTQMLAKVDRELAREAATRTDIAQ